MTNAALKLPEITTHTLHLPANDTNGEPPFRLPLLPPGQDITLAMLEALFPPSDAGCRAIHLRCYSETDLVEEGNKVDTQRILDAVPNIVVSVVRTLTKLSSKQADCVVIDAEILGVIVHETTKLASLHGDFLASKPGRSVRRSALDVAQAETRKAALVERDLVRVGLSQVLGATTDAELAPAQDASSVAALAQGLTHLADLIDRVLAKGTDDERAQLERRRLGAPRATSLRAMAGALTGASVAATAAPAPRVVTQRELDLQDGVVLVLLDALDECMQQAHRTSAAIELPEYGGLAKRYRSRSGRRSRKSDAGEVKAPVSGEEAPKTPVK